MSTALAVKAAKVPPSPFSVLLRRSKFASYDPQIGQIYTTYDGSAARGDWGLKRPLSVRRRDGRLLINNIDTLYQQTEWKSAFSDASAIRKFEEMGVTPGLDPAGNWAPRLAVHSKSHKPSGIWTRDSDYASPVPGKIEKDIERFAPLPDPSAMSPKRLERYLRKVRRLQPKFKEFIDLEIREKQGREPERLHELAHLEYTRDHERFLSDKFVQACKAEDSTMIRPLPHPTAGLTYAYSNDYQRALTSKPVPGRRLYYDSVRGTPKALPVNVDVAGWTAKEIVKSGDPDVTMTDWGSKEGEPRQDADAGKEVFKPLFKPDGCTLVVAPDVVGKYPQRMEAAKIRMHVISWTGAEAHLENPHRPGTPEYIAYAKPNRAKAIKSVAQGVDYKKPRSRFKMDTTQRPKMVSSKENYPAGLLATLQTIANKDRTGNNDPLRDGAQDGSKFGDEPYPKPNTNA